MPAESSIVVEGKITAVLPGTMFRVELSNNHLVLAHLSMSLRHVSFTGSDNILLKFGHFQSFITSPG